MAPENEGLRARESKRTRWRRRGRSQWRSFGVSGASKAKNSSEGSASSLKTKTLGGGAWRSRDGSDLGHKGGAMRRSWRVYGAALFIAWSGVLGHSTDAKGGGGTPVSHTRAGVGWRRGTGLSRAAWLLGFGGEDRPGFRWAKRRSEGLTAGPDERGRSVGQQGFSPQGNKKKEWISDFKKRLKIQLSTNKFRKI